MAKSALIHDKLLTDFAALKYENNVNIFTSVKKVFRSEAMTDSDCLIMPDNTNEEVNTGSSGNTQTTRINTFIAVVLENFSNTDTDSEAAIKYTRLLNKQDAILDYLQKEPSNLNSWGNTNGIAIYKVRAQPGAIFIQEKTESGYQENMGIRFTIYYNVVPQNL